MIKQKRYERILSILNENHAVSIEELCDAMDVSKATVRRDLAYLDAQKLLKRTHGGAVTLVKSTIEDVPIAIRHRAHKPEKERIAKAALPLIHDGETIYVGTGTTMRLLASYLRAFSRLTVLTNDIGVAHEIAQNTTNGLIVSGGRLTPTTTSLVGDFAKHALCDLHVDIAFLSADAISADGFMDKNTDEVAIKRMMVQNASKSIMLCDQSKLNMHAFMTVCPLRAIDLTLIDGEIDPEIERTLLDAGMVMQSV